MCAILVFCYIYLFFNVEIRAESNNVANKTIKQEIQEAGCPFHNNQQLLRKNVCLMPGYATNEPPENENGETYVDIDWQGTPQVTGIEENKNIITLQMHQLMEWEDLRIKSNLSAMQNMECPECWTKLFPPSVEKIWHPNLDMHIQDLWDWKSLYDPFWFESVGLNRCSWMRNCNMASNVTHLYADKRWRANVFCKFDFLLFPLDSQHCKFRQRFQSTSEFVKFFLYPTSKNMFRVNVTKTVGNWEYRGIGFDITIQPIGNLIGLRTPLGNRAQK